MAPTTGKNLLQGAAPSCSASETLMDAASGSQPARAEESLGIARGLMVAPLLDHPDRIVVGDRTFFLRKPTR